MEKMNNKGLGPGLIRGESMLFTSKRNSKGDRNHGEELWKYERRADV